MSRCEQELCENWTGDGNVCACDLFDLPKPCRHRTFIADEFGDHLCAECDHEWWEDPL